MCWHIFDVSSFCRVVLTLILLSRIITELQRTVEWDELKHESTSLSVRRSSLIPFSPSVIFTVCWDFSLHILARSFAEQLLHHAQYLWDRHIPTSYVNISASVSPSRSTVWVNVSFRSFIRYDNVDGLRCRLWLRPWQMGMWQQPEICTSQRRALPDTSACWWTFRAPNSCSDVHAQQLK